MDCKVFRFTDLQSMSDDKKKWQGKTGRKRKIKAHIGEGELPAVMVVNLCLPELTLH